MIKILHIPTGFIFSIEENFLISLFDTNISSSEIYHTFLATSQQYTVLNFIGHLEDTKIIPRTARYQENIEDIKNTMCIEEFEVLDV